MLTTIYKFFVISFIATSSFYVYSGCVKETKQVEVKKVEETKTETELKKEIDVKEFLKKESEVPEVPEVKSTTTGK